MITHGYRGQLGDQNVIIWGGLGGKKEMNRWINGVPHVERRLNPKKVILGGWIWFSWVVLRSFWVVSWRKKRGEEEEGRFAASR